MNIYDRIEALCEARNVSTGEVESAVNLSRSSITKWKKSYPTANKLMAVADFFNVSTDYLLGREEIKYDATTLKFLAIINKDKRLKKIIDYCNNLDDEGRNKVLEQAEMFASNKRYIKKPTAEAKTGA